MKDKITIIPKPYSLTERNGAFQFSDNSIYADLQNLQDDEREAAKIAFSCANLTINEKNAEKANDCIKVSLFNQPEYEGNDLKKEETYALTVDENGISIFYTTTSGLFYACITASQLIFHAINEENCKSQKKINFLTIYDTPQYKWRGFLLDTCRTFFTLSFIKKMLDAMALHKMNTFHWHLTDDQGWRMYIEKFPRLTEIGAVRKDHTMPEADDGFYDHGQNLRFYYTKEEMLEVVDYARQRNITVVPEVEFPGHASALLASYPEFGCEGRGYAVENRWGIFPSVMCLGNDKLFDFFKEVIEYVASVFPGKYIHIGGDECPTTKWKTCPKCQRRMKEQKLQTESQLQSWATAKITKMVEDCGKIAIGWDEVLQNCNLIPLPKNLMVQSWQGIEGGEKASALGHKVIMSPQTMCYLNLKNEDSLEEPGRLGFITLETAYLYSPVTENMSDEAKAFIEGGECTFWSEKIQGSKIVEYMLFPRFCAISEGLWLSKDKKNFADFKERIESHKKLLHSLKFLYFEE